MSKKNVKKLSVITAGLILFAMVGFVGSLNVSQAETSSYVFTEDFTASTYNDLNNRETGIVTNAFWNTKKGELSLPKEGNNQEKPSIILGEEKSVYVGYNQNGQIYLQRIDDNGNRHWPEDIKISDDSRNYFSAPAITKYHYGLFQTGYIETVWSSWSDPKNLKLAWQQTHGETGVSRFSNSEISADNLSDLAIAYGGDGFYHSPVFVIWSGGEVKVSLQKLKMGASFLEPAGSVEIDKGIRPDIVAGKGEYIYVVWNNIDKGIFLQKYDHDLNKLWSKNVMISSSGNAPSITIDANNKIFVTWQKCKGGQPGNKIYDIYIQKFDTDGNKEWFNDFKVVTMNETTGVSSPMPKITTSKTNQNGKIFVVWHNTADKTLRLIGFDEVVSGDLRCSFGCSNAGSNLGLAVNLRQKTLVHSFDIVEGENNISANRPYPYVYLTWNDDAQTGRFYNYDLYIQKFGTGDEIKGWSDNLLVHKIDPYITSMAAVQSKKINTTSDNIVSAILTVDHVIPTIENSYIKYYLSADGGKSWEQAVITSNNSSQKIYFDNIGNDLRWKAELSSGNKNVSSIIKNISISYSTDYNGQKLPDLIVDSISFDDDFHSTSIKIKNIGEADYVYCKSMEGNVCIGNDFDIDWEDLSSGKKGSTYNHRLVDIPVGKSEKFTLTREIVSPGIHELEIIVDSKNNIQESDENNNTKNLTISVSEIKLPDLIVEKAELRKHTDPHRGEQDIIAVTVKNTGNGYYIYTDSRMERFINWSDALTGAEEGYTGNYRLISIGPGESKEYIKQYIHSPDLELLRVSVDPENKVKESNEKNNSINIKVDSDSVCLPDGTLIKLPHDPKIYVIKDCKKKWIKTLDEFNQGGYNWSNIQETDSEVINAYADYLETTANLLRSIGHHKVYRIINGKRLWIPTVAAFNAQGLKWNDIQNVANVTEYPRLKLAKLANKPEVYYLNENGFKRHIPTADVFNSYGNKWEDIVEVSSSELNSYPDSALIRENYKIYKLENGKKKWIKTAGAFNRLGYDWNQVSLVNQTEIDSYTSGTSIE